MRCSILLALAEFANTGLSLDVLREIEAGTAKPTVETRNRFDGIFGLSA